MVDLRQLEALRAVHAEGSVTAAARRLGWGQPTVDYHLKNLERLVGAEVLVRSPRGSRLTPVGMLLLERAQEILTLSERAITDARELTQTGRTRLRFGTFTSAAQLLPPVVLRLNGQGIEVDVVLEEVPSLVDRSNRGEVDAALVYTVPGYGLAFRSTVTAIEVHREPLLLTLPVGHPLASRTSIDVPTLLTLHEERWMFAAAGGDSMDTIVVDTFAAAGHTIEIAIRTDDFQVMLAMTGARMGIGLVPRMAAVGAHPGIVLRPIDDPAFVRSILVAVPAAGAARRPSAAVRQLVAAVRDGFTALRAEAEAE
ncbi:LysR family transcriptional regulator [Microbacterium azadirachtae]|uniref:LysR family transcriptional regulator n=1 Tax=Microbacterium azadirachtae TaxID=582680 RepID=UPI0021D4A424|nr:LysR family transcriptional regulator [Microbacterium azadirachtae]UXW87325.1 LysR family transcriptional regulator [Microbacterium azadirachtae]